MLTVVCWKWNKNAWRPIYGAYHVHLLQYLVAKHLKTKHRFVCITDDPSGLNCETLPLPHVNIGEAVLGKPNCFMRLWLFSREAKELLGDQVLSIDLDTIVVGDITDLVQFNGPLKMVKGVSAPYNGSMWLLRPGELEHVWLDFNLKAAAEASRVTHYKGSDQAWISYKAPGHPTWDQTDGVYQYTLTRFHKPGDNMRILFFAGNVKPWTRKFMKRYPGLWNQYVNDATLAGCGTYLFNRLRNPE